MVNFGFLLLFFHIFIRLFIGLQILKVIVKFADNSHNEKSLMTNEEFWKDIQSVIATDFNARSIDKLEKYAELFISGKLLFKRFLQQGEIQAKRIERWARNAGCWFDDVDLKLKESFGEYISEGGEAKVYDNGPSPELKCGGLRHYTNEIEFIDSYDSSC